MKIEHLLGLAEVNNLDELINIINLTDEQSRNEFWLSVRTNFPCMCISVSREFAHIQYFVGEDDPGVQAIGNLNFDNESMLFITNSNETVEFEGEYILRKEDAIKAAREFFIKNELPKFLKWDEL